GQILMKLVRFGQAGSERPGIVDSEGTVRDLTRIVTDIDAAILAPQELDRLRTVDLKTLPPVPGAVRLGACVARPGKFICIGLNYADHAKETGAPIPAEPVVFMKATSAVCGPSE